MASKWKAGAVFFSAAMLMVAMMITGAYVCVIILSQVVIDMSDLFRGGITGLLLFGLGSLVIWMGISGNMDEGDSQWNEVSILPASKAGPSQWLFFDTALFRALGRRLPLSKLNGIHIFVLVMYILVSVIAFLTDGFAEEFIEYTIYSFGLFMVVYFLVLQWLHEKKYIGKGQ